MQIHFYQNYVFGNTNCKTSNRIMLWNVILMKELYDNNIKSEHDIGFIQLNVQAKARFKKSCTIILRTISTLNWMRIPSKKQRILTMRYRMVYTGWHTILSLNIIIEMIIINNIKSVYALKIQCILRLSIHNPSASSDLGIKYGVPLNWMSSKKRSSPPNN